MVKKIVLHFWSMRRQFVKYFIVGFSGFLLDLGTLIFLTDFLHIMPVVAVTINGLFMINYIFFLNKHWTFRTQGVTKRQMKRFLILAGANYIFGILWMYIFNHEFGFDAKLVRVANIALAVAWNFLLYKYWVYKHDEIPSEPAGSAQA